MDSLTTEISLAERDMQLNKIQKEITFKKQLLLEKYIYLKDKKNTNIYLEGVKGDYQEYYNHLLKEKRKQEEAMQSLKQYLEKLMKVNKLADDERSSMKQDHEEILSEIRKIKNELDNLMHIKDNSNSDK